MAHRPDGDDDGGPTDVDPGDGGPADVDPGDGDAVPDDDAGPSVEAHCNNDLDDDGDGWIDCGDPDCRDLDRCGCAELNACGGCSSLQAAPGDACAVQGTWTCMGGSLRCIEPVVCDACGRDSDCLDHERCAAGCCQSVTEAPAMVGVAFVRLAGAADVFRAHEVPCTIDVGGGIHCHDWEGWGERIATPTARTIARGPGDDLCAIDEGGQATCGTRVLDVAGAVAIAASVGTTCALDETGRTRCFDGDEELLAFEARATALAAAQHRVCQLSAGGAIACIGDDAATEVLASDSGWTSIRVSEHWLCGQTEAGDARCLDGDGVEVFSASGVDELALSPSYPESGLLCTLASGSARCLSADGGAAFAPDEDFVRLALGERTACAVTERGGVRVWHAEGERALPALATGPRYRAVEHRSPIPCLYRADGMATCMRPFPDGLGGTELAIAQGDHWNTGGSQTTTTCAVGIDGRCQDSDGRSFEVGPGVAVTLLPVPFLSDDVTVAVVRNTGAVERVDSGGRRSPLATSVSAFDEDWRLEPDGRARRDSDDPLIPTRYASIEASGSLFCGIRSADRRADCWSTGRGDDPDRPMPWHVRAERVPITNIDELGPLASIASNVNVCALAIDGRVACDGPTAGGVPQSLLEPPGVPMRAVFVWLRFACGIREVDGRLQCWGAVDRVF